MRPPPTAACLFLTIFAVLASCARPPAAAFDPQKVPAVVIGRSSRAEVFAALGRPAQTRQSAAGETWVYETKSGGGQGFGTGATAVAGVVGVFVPFGGLIGPGMGLAGAAAGAGQSEADTVSLTVGFGQDGIVRDCVLSSTAIPAGLPGTPGSAPAGGGCQRPQAPPPVPVP